MTFLWYINLAYACYGLVEKDTKVIQAPPIARWMIGKNIHYCLNWVTGKGGTISKVCKL